MGAAQDLQQKVCQRFGWSLVYSVQKDGRWRADMVTGIGEGCRKSFVTESAFAEEKEGKSAVSELTLQGLASEIAFKEAQPAQELTQVFSYQLESLPLLDSRDPETWKRFWEDSPKVVGIDTEGNRISPPVLVQVATKDYVILEVPRKKLSRDMERLLKDDFITKVFCDNFAHKDKVCLGLEVQDNATFTNPPIVDLESLAMPILGPVKMPRGLGRIISLTMPELQVRIEKPKVAKGNMKGRFSNISRFALIEQGKAKPLRGLFDLNVSQQRYAALDAWCTLHVYERLMERA